MAAMTSFHAAKCYLVSKNEMAAAPAPVCSTSNSPSRMWYIHTVFGRWTT